MAGKSLRGFELKALMLTIIPLTALSFVHPIYATKVIEFETLPDCVISNIANAASPILVDCKMTPSDNGYVDNLFPTKAFGGSGVLIVQNVPSVPVSMTYAFLKFELKSNVPSGILQCEARPENASLRMYVRLMNFFYNATVEIHDASSANWTENTLTWNTMPEFDRTDYVSLNIMQNGTWAQWNITPLVQPNDSSQVAFAAISSETNWKNLIWFDSDEYSFSNGTTSPILELTYVEPYLTIETPFAVVPVSIGGNTFRTDEDGSIKVLMPWGNYLVTVPDTISIANGTRAKFVDWSDRVNSSSRMLPVGNNVTVKANYGTQHQLILSSPFGIVSGAGWYFENTQATISINPAAVPVNGVEGWFGGRHVFDHWIGACTTTSPDCNVLMNRPEYAEAVWRIDWSQTIIGGSLVTVSLSLLTLLRKRLRGRGSTKRRANRTHGIHRYVHHTRSPRSRSRRRG